MVTLTGFSDEISSDLEEQLKGLAELGIHHLELRGVWGKNVLQLSEEEVGKVKALLQEYNCSVSSIASPIGKYAVQDDIGPQLEAVRRAVELAGAFGAQYIRVFSYFIPKGEQPAVYRDEVISRMRQLTEIAEQGGVTLVLENDSGLYGSTDDNVYDLVSSVNSPALRLAFDPGNFVMQRIAPMSQAYGKLAPYIEYVHIKDADQEKRIFVAAGEGDGELADLIQTLKNTSFSGFLSIEPHLHKAYPDASNPERFAIAANALKALLAAEAVAWN